MVAQDTGHVQEKKQIAVTRMSEGTIYDVRLKYFLTHLCAYATVDQWKHGP